MNEAEYKELAYQKANDNHIWLNAMNCINPTDEFKIKLADMILEKLNFESCLIPGSSIISDDETLKKLGELTPILFLRINKS